MTLTGKRDPWCWHASPALAEVMPQIDTAVTDLGREVIAYIRRAEIWLDDEAKGDDLIADLFGAVHVKVESVLVKLRDAARAMRDDITRASIDGSLPTAAQLVGLYQVDRDIAVVGVAWECFRAWSLQSGRRCI